MKAATITQIKRELKERSHADLITICLELFKLNPNNKLMLSYLLFATHDKQAYINDVKHIVTDFFETLDLQWYKKAYVKIKKTLVTLKKYIRLANEKETEIILLLHFCKEFKNIPNPINKSLYMQVHFILHYAPISRLYYATLESIGKKLEKMDPDLQHDYGLEIAKLRTLN